MVAKNYRRNDYRAIFYLWWCLLYRNNFLIVALAIAIPIGVYILLATQNLITDNISLQWNIFFNRNTLVSMFLFVQIFASLSICATCIGHFKEMHIADQIIVNYRKNKFIGTTFIYFFMVNVVCTIWAFAWYCVFNYSHLQDILQSYSSDGGNINIDVIGIILTNIINIIMVLVTSMAVGFFCNSNMVRTVITCVLFGMATLLSGSFVPLIYYHNNEWFNVIAYLSPFRYTNGLMEMAWSSIGAYHFGDFVIQNGGLWNATSDYSIMIDTINNNHSNSTSITNYEIVLSWIIPLVLISVLSLVIVRYPRWKKM